MIANVTFKDAGGKRFALHDWKDRKAVVVVFLSFDCPVSTGYSPVLADLAKVYAERGVAFLGICTQEDKDAAQITRHQQEFKIPFPVFADERRAAADAFQAEVTPEAFVLDNHFVLRYRGRIDDGYRARLKKNAQVTRHDLRQALDEVLADKPVSEPATRAIGCGIRQPEAVRATAGPTYYRDVLPIVQNHCQECHRAGEVAPFSLMTYKQAVSWATDIKEYTQSRKMPPWKPTEGGPFYDERRLTEREIATLAAWVDGGAPEGTVADAPPPRRFAKGWQLGQPDMVLTVDGDFELGARGSDIYRYFVLPTNLAEDKYVTAIEVRPGNGRVVHHAIMFYDSQGRARKLEQQERARPKKPTEEDRGPGYSMSMGLGFLPGFLPQGGLGGWAPGMIPRHLAEGVGFYLPKGSDVVLQLHYHRNGRVESDRTSVGLYFAKKAEARRMQGLAIPGQFVTIPAGVERYRVNGSIWVRQDCRLHTIMPHMHLLGREIKVTMIPPDAPPRTLIAVKDWDFNWQEMYFFREAIPVKAGTRFDVEGIYDNSAKNPSNPNRPPKSVLVGEATNNEMCVGFLGTSTERPGPIRYDILVGVPGLGLKGPTVPGLGL
jgi:peroxiredoxin